ncbi:MAG: ATPase, partial [Saprospiraceae bacterium]|nr:ATPase [Saprospiraceae bacterium]
MSSPSTFLCLTCYFKGADFLTACKSLGNTIYLVTSKKLENEPWPWDDIDDVYYMEEDDEGQWNMTDLLEGLAFIFRSVHIDRILALDDFDVERVALLREHFRMPGMGQTTARYFRDKLAMRMKAKEGGILVPGFSALFNDAQIDEFIMTYPGPWVVKPRSAASAIGIKKVNDPDELWSVLQEAGDERHHHLVEQFLPGDVYHIDALSVAGKNIFNKTSQYLNTPLEVAHGGGIFRTMTLDDHSADAKNISKINQELMQVFGMQHSVSHSEYIK